MSEPVPCMVCEKLVEDYVAERCCDGQMCGCMGLPVEPPLCPDCWFASLYTAAKARTQHRRMEQEDEQP